MACPAGTHHRREFAGGGGGVVSRHPIELASRLGGVDEAGAVGQAEPRRMQRLQAQSPAHRGPAGQHGTRYRHAETTEYGRQCPGRQNRFGGQVERARGPAPEDRTDGHRHVVGVHELQT